MVPVNSGNGGPWGHPQRGLVSSSRQACSEQKPAKKQVALQNGKTWKSKDFPRPFHKVTSQLFQWNRHCSRLSPGIIWKTKKVRSEHSGNASEPASHTGLSIVIWATLVEKQTTLTDCKHFHINFPPFPVFFPFLSHSVFSFFSFLFSRGTKK